MEQEKEVRYCQHCGRKMKKNSYIWDLHTCSICYRTLEQYKHLRAADQSGRYRNWYKNPENKKKELLRAKKNYQKIKESLKIKRQALKKDKQK